MLARDRERNLDGRRPAPEVAWERTSVLARAWPATRPQWAKKSRVDVTVGAVVAAVAATAVGSTVQGSLGFGMNLVSVPVLALVLPEALPVTVIVIGIPIAIEMARYERHALDWAGVGWIMAGRLPGTIFGAWVVATVSTSVLQAVAGAVVLTLVVASAALPPLPVRPGTQISAGLVSGVTGTSAGIGGPPLALLYQHHPGPTMRSTLAASFLFGTVLSLVTLGLARQVGADEVLLGVGLAPVVVAGSVAGRRFHGFLERKWLRPAILVVAGSTALAALLHALG
jgi:uncharacterized membrane protein YfcA